MNREQANIELLRGVPASRIEEALQALYPLVSAETDPLTGVIRNAAGDTVMSGLLDNGKWANPPSIFRLLCNGSGTITLDAKDAAGNISLGAFSVTLSGAVNQIEYPYCGDAVVQVRANTTGTATAQVI